MIPRLDACLLSSFARKPLQGNARLCWLRGSILLRSDPRGRLHGPCPAHVRRTFGDIHRSQGYSIANGAIVRIAQFYAAEKEAIAAPPDRRAELRRHPIQRR
jgi:hypothetical protein